MNADQLADPAGGGGPCIGCRLDCGHVAANYRCDKAGSNLFVADQRDIGGLDHRVGRLDHRDQSFGLDHSESFHLFSFHLPRISPDSTCSNLTALLKPKKGVLNPKRGYSIPILPLHNNIGLEEGLVPAALNHPQYMSHPASS